MSEALLGPPLASIIISNYNYGSFLREAIDSALNQTYPNIEVIVVDDGSSDNSRQVIASYGDRILPLLKENGGHASTLNEGFSLSNGEIVIFLDADDALLPGIVSRAYTVFQDNPNVAKVQYRMQVVSARSEPTGELLPPSYRRMPSGDLRQHVLKFHSYQWQATSGNAFTASVLQRILPMPEDLYQRSPDGYLSDLSVMFGPLVSLDEVGALYRMHGNNDHLLEPLTSLVRLRQTLRQTEYGCMKQKQLFKALYSADVREVGLWDLLFLRNRMISLKLDPPNHPLQDGLLSLCTRGCISSMIFPTLRWYERLVYVFWFTAMLIVPRPFAKYLTEKLFQPEMRGWLMNKLATTVRRI